MPQQVILCFISSTNGDVYERLLSSTEVHKIFDLKSIDTNDRLFAQKGEQNCWDLSARLESTNYQDPLIVAVEKCFAREAVADLNYRTSEPGTWDNFGEVLQLGKAPTNHWKFSTGFYAAEGLYTSYRSGKPWVRCSFETPFGQWMVRNATQLPNDQVIFQLGEDQICIFDPATKEVALLEHGRGPVVGLTGDSSKR